MTETKDDLVERLLHAITTAHNDDLSAPMSEKRDRHVKRMETMQDAVDELRSIRLQLVKAREVLQQSKAAMIEIRRCSMIGAMEGYGKPESWGDELFRSHGPVTAAIKAIDALPDDVGKA